MDTRRQPRTEFGLCTSSLIWTSLLSQPSSRKKSSPSRVSASQARGVEPRHPDLYRPSPQEGGAHSRYRPVLQLCWAQGGGLTSCATSTSFLRAGSQSISAIFSHPSDFSAFHSQLSLKVSHWGVANHWTLFCGPSSKTTTTATTLLDLVPLPYYSSSAPVNSSHCHPGHPASPPPLSPSTVATSPAGTPLPGRRSYSAVNYHLPLLLPPSPGSNHSSNSSTGSTPSNSDYYHCYHDYACLCLILVACPTTPLLFPPLAVAAPPHPFSPNPHHPVPPPLLPWLLLLLLLLQPLPVTKLP